MATLDLTLPKQAAKDTTSRSTWAVVGVLCLAVLTINIDTTIVNVALPTMARELQAGTSELQWFVDAYNLTFAALVLAAGSLGDRYGRKGALLAGLGVFGSRQRWAGWSDRPTRCSWCAPEWASAPRSSSRPRSPSSRTCTRTGPSGRRPSAPGRP